MGPFLYLPSPPTSPSNSQYIVTLWQNAVCRQQQKRQQYHRADLHGRKIELSTGPSGQGRSIQYQEGLLVFHQSNDGRRHAYIHVVSVVLAFQRSAGMKQFRDPPRPPLRHTHSGLASIKFVQTRPAQSSALASDVPFSRSPSPPLIPCGYSMRKKLLPYEKQREMSGDSSACARRTRAIPTTGGTRSSRFA